MRGRLDRGAAAPAQRRGPDQRRLRHLVPEDRLRAYAVRPVLQTLRDGGSVLELCAGFGAGVVAVLARLDGRPVGVLADDPADTRALLVGALRAAGG
ncbi:carboxyl transferase domain-containing protein [Pseudonocardia oceani]|uniref:carboxyl transferase domain-containing protein n=1 Tax=Pseudonocardia oceani TaxID=2792013 RepID=UPI001CF714C4|nr:carboxyl transferase domain-containing protein [Pseudonocardia oceani]